MLKTGKKRVLCAIYSRFEGAGRIPREMRFWLYIWRGGMADKAHNKDKEKSRVLLRLLS